MLAQNVKAILKRYFTEFPVDNSKWKCRCGKILNQRPNTGWSNLFQHIKSQHSDYLQDSQSTLQSSVVSKPASTKKAATIYSWLVWICCGLKTFNFVGNDLTRKYCVPCTKKYLDPMAPIVQLPVFENAVCKLQKGQQSDLTEGEKDEISILLIRSVSQPEDVRIVNEEEDFASSIIKRRRQECETKSPDRMYIDTRFLLLTSNILERFFSTADIRYSDIRQFLLPQNLETQLFLMINKKFWTLDVVEKCINSVDTWKYPFACYLFSTLK